ncbi:MAG: hypothetical protein HGB33_02840 [Syntrophaceae bacterium]|nr:hypothetical protein [Syntrophaceae bacterium]
MKKTLSLKEIFQGKITRLGIEEIIPAATGRQKQFSKIKIRLINRIPYSTLINNTPTIAIVSLRVLSKFCAKQDNILKDNFVFLILAESSTIPADLKNLPAGLDVTVAASKYDEHYLKSLLKELIREKFQETVFVHGVLLEAEGKGILITGASGIGKTTAALKTAAKDYYWVADDIAVIKKNKRYELIGAGHKKISNYLHTEATGIIPVVNLLKPERIKKSTKLVAVVEVEKTTKYDAPVIIEGKKDVLGKKLICFHINIPSTGYFNENLLVKAITQLS